MDYLVRYGVIPEVARCSVAEELDLARGDAVVLRTHRGLQTGSVVERLRARSVDHDAPAASVHSDEISAFVVVRRATAEDQTRLSQFADDADSEFAQWCERIAQWKIDVQLIDLEWT
ncbi:MAG: hypothetical protein KDA75_07340, partial [Planctomycetaceae bacterium]|nr:hypothetical protein [Planctomycetaceae bacterium]